MCPRRSGINESMAINIEKVLEEWEKDAVIDESKLDRVTIDTSLQHAKYIKILASAKMEFLASKQKHECLKKAMWLYYTGKMTKEEMDDRGWDYDPYKGGAKPLKSEIGQWIDADPNMQKQTAILEYRKMVIETIEDIISTIRWRHQSIKNIIEYKRFQAGY